MATGAPRFFARATASANSAPVGRFVARATVALKKKLTVIKNSHTDQSVIALTSKVRRASRTERDPQSALEPFATAKIVACKFDVTP